MTKPSPFKGTPRPNIMEAIEGLHYPVSIDDVVARAEGNRAAPEMLALLRKLPKGSYANAGEINHVLGKIESHSAPASY